MTTPELSKIYQMIDSLSPKEKRLLVEHITDSIEPVSSANSEEDLSFTEEELSEMLAPKPSLTGREIAEKHLESGVIGSWADMGITDSVEWVAEQRAKHRNKF